MSTLKSALLGVLPVSERTAVRGSGEPGEKLFQDNVTAPGSTGVEGLKAALKPQASSFKYNADADRLYVYFTTAAVASAAYTYFRTYPAVIGHLKLQQAGLNSFRIDGASKFVRGQKADAVVTQTFEQFVQGVKDAFSAFRSGTVSLTYKVDKTAKRVYAYASSNRKNGAEFARAKAVLSTTHKFHVVNSGEYTIALRFDFDQKQEVGYNTLIKGLEETIPATPVAPAPVKAPVVQLADPASKLEGLVPQETLEQVRRILAGERLPKPVPKPRFETAGKTELKLFVSAGKELDLAVQIAALNQTGKDSAVFTYGQLGYAYFGSTTIHNPTVVIMRDYKNPKGAFVVLRTAAGYHQHMQIKQV